MVLGVENGVARKDRVEPIDVLSTKAREETQTNQHATLLLAMQVQLIVGAVLSLLAWWLENEMPLSPHHMAQYLLSVSGTSSYHP